MQEFLIRFDRRLGQHIVARRRESIGDLPKILQGKNFSIESLLIGPNNSRNTVASEGSMRISIGEIQEDINQVFTALQEWINPLSATIQTHQGNSGSQEYEITFHGISGHTSKVGTVEDDGMTTVLTDATTLISPFVNSVSDSAMPTNQEIRVNIGNMSIRRRQRRSIEFSGEARYRSGKDVQLVLDSMRNLVHEFGGTWESIEENRAYQLDENAGSVKEMVTLLEANGYTPNFLSQTFGISDANNSPRQWNTVVFSDGSMNPHRSDESISLESVYGLLRIFNDLATGKYA